MAPTDDHCIGSLIKLQHHSKFRNSYSTCILRHGIGVGGVVDGAFSFITGELVILGLHSRDFRYNLPFSSAMLGFQNQYGGQCVDHVVTNW